MIIVFLFRDSHSHKEIEIKDYEQYDLTCFNILPTKQVC